MTYYIKRGNCFSVTDEGSVDIRKILPPDTFMVKLSMSGYYLETVDNMTIPNKLYGDTNSRAERILNTYEQRKGSTGVLLCGEKGSGKTLLSKLISIRARQKGYPTLLINNPYNDEDFNAFMQKISQPVVVVFDEMEKVYHKMEDQRNLLTLFDGIFSTKKLWVITCNDKWKIDGHIHNRPGRAFYNIDYVGLDSKFITEYCNDALKDKAHIPKLCQIAGMFRAFNFDLLSALVEEMNRYNEDPFQAIEMLNAKPEKDYAQYDHELFLSGCTTRHLNTGCSISHNSPLSVTEFTIHFTQEIVNPNDKDDVDYKVVDISFSLADLKSFKAETGIIEYVNKNLDRVVFNKRKAADYKLDHLRDVL